jgi:hypothetical protein
MRRLLTWLFVSIATTSMPGENLTHAQDVEIDPLTGLKMNENWELVRNNCIACHSLKLVTQQRGTSTQWLAIIRWMQDKQNLGRFDPDTENKIIVYLAENYPPQENQRRATLAPQLMPPNPYSADAEPPIQNPDLGKL